MTGAEPESRVAFVSTPNRERYLLEADSLRRRQLRAALLHGSSRTWRERRRAWPGVVAGIIVAAVIVAGIAVYGAFRKQKEINEEEQRLRVPPVVSVSPSRSPSGKPSSTKPPASRSPSPSRSPRRSPSPTRSSPKPTP